MSQEKVDRYKVLIKNSSGDGYSVSEAFYKSEEEFLKYGESATGDFFCLITILKEPKDRSEK